MKLKFQVESLAVQPEFVDFITKALQPNVTLVISACDAISRKNEKYMCCFELLLSLGFTVPLFDKWRHSYIGVLSNGNVACERESAKEKIAVDLNIHNFSLSITSANFNAGNTSEIKVNGIDYSLGKRGLNLVLLQTSTGRIIDYANFDTFVDFRMHRNASLRSNTAHRRIFALMTGSVRNQYDMFTMLCLLSDYCKQGIIEGVVWSTWTGEADAILGLREKLSVYGVRIIETPPPVPINSSIAQITQIYNGLALVPNDAWVIRVRTDYSIFAFVPLIATLYSEHDLSITPVGAFPHILSQKIVCLDRVSLGCIFYLRDHCFAATKNDMLKMSSIVDTKHICGAHIFPEASIFGNPFFNVLPILADYYSFFAQYFNCGNLGVIPGHRLSAFTEKLLLNVDALETFQLSSLINKVFAVVLPLYYSHFYFVNHNKTVDRGDVQFADIFTVLNSDKKRLVRSCAETKFLKKLVKAEVFPCYGYWKFSREFQLVLTDTSYSLSMRINDTDCQEAVDILAERGIRPFQPNKMFIAGREHAIEWLGASSYALFDFLNDKELLQLKSLYSEHLDFADYSNRLLCALENNAEILPRQGNLIC